MEEADQAITVSDLVMDRQGRIRWAVTAIFVGVASAEPRCIEYRVRVVSLEEDVRFQKAFSRQIVKEMEADAGSDSRSDVWKLSEVDPPAEGIPNYVFTQASQARLIEKAREQVSRQSQRYSDSAKALLARQVGKRRGRPPARSMDEKLAVLQTAERIFAAGGTRAGVARAHHMSESAVRDLLGWARKDANPPLFTGNGPGRRGGALTDFARHLIAEKETEA